MHDDGGRLPRDDRPAVTVIIRSQGRATLAEALASVARQTYPNIDVLVVDATGGHHPPLDDHCGAHLLRMVAAGRRLNRPEAANCGLDHAHGEWLIFLDDDDYFDPPHVASLVEAAAVHGSRVAYSGTRVQDDRGLVISVLNQPYGRLELFNNNYIQMGAALFHRSLIDLGCRFDESMLLYQDWDFWLQLAAHEAFAHTGTVTTNWRAHIGRSGAGAGPNADPALQMRFGGRMREKWGGVRHRLVAYLGKVARHATWLISHRRSQRAVQILTAALVLAPDDPGLLNLLGIACFHAGHLRDAWRFISMAHRVLPDNGSIRRNLAMVERAQSGAPTASGGRS